MKQKLKNDIKDTVQIIGIALASGVVVFNINAFFKPTSKKDGTKQNIERVISKADTISAMHDSTIVQNIFQKTR